MGKADDRGRLNLGPLGHLGDGAKGHVGRMIERELGYQPKPIGKAGIAVRNLLAQRVIHAELIGFCSQSRSLDRPFHRSSQILTRNPFISLHKADRMIILCLKQELPSNL
jgi:hypothetical protein